MVQSSRSMHGAGKARRRFSAPARVNFALYDGDDESDGGTGPSGGTLPQLGVYAASCLHARPFVSSGASYFFRRRVAFPRPFYARPSFIFSAVRGRAD